MAVINVGIWIFFSYAGGGATETRNIISLVFQIIFLQKVISINKIQ